MGALAEAAIGIDPALILHRAGIIPDTWQDRIVCARARQTLLNCSRQAGKSTTVAAMALDEAISNAPSLTLLICPTRAQAQELLRTILSINGKLLLGHASEIEDESSIRAEFATGSRIVALPGKEESVRGYAKVGLLIVDEASRVPDALYRAIRPMLAVSHGRIVCLSTPYGKRGFFFEEWSRGGHDWERVRIPANLCPRITPEFLEQERRSLPESWYLQEYFCEFADAAGSVFRYDDIQRAITSDVKPLFGNAVSPTLPLGGVTESIKPLFMGHA